MIEYKIVRSRRKTAAIHVLEDGSVEVRCPKHLTDKEIEKAVREKQEWICRKVTEKHSVMEQKNAFVLQPGANLLFMGKEYLLTASDGDKAGFDGDNFYVPYGCETVKDTVIKLYKLLAQQVIGQKVIEYAKRMNCSPAGVKINSAQKRWGSCSGKDSLNFTWRLVLAEEKCIDYVVIHELAHTLAHNHSQRFWNIVADMMPDYKQQEKKLSELQDKLSRENWG